MADSKSVPFLQPGITGEEAACVDVHSAGGHGDKRTRGCESWHRGRSALESTGVASISWLVASSYVVWTNRWGRLQGKRNASSTDRKRKAQMATTGLHNGDGLPHSSS